MSSGHSDSLYEVSEYLIAVVWIIPIPSKGLSGRPLKIIRTTANWHRSDLNPQEDCPRIENVAKECSSRTGNQAKADAM